MKRKLLLIISALLIASSLFFIVRITYSLKEVTRGGLQVTANSKGTVYLDGNKIGSIPIRKIDPSQTIPTGTYELKIEPEDKTSPTFINRIKINGGVLTAIDKTFLPGSLGSSYILTLEKSSNPKPQLEITTIPDGALVTIDSVAVGSTPYRSENISASEHEVEIQKIGFAKKTIRVKTVENYILVVNARLGTGDINSVPNQFQVSTPSALIASPTPLQASTKITILNTPNGFLRVRNGAGTTFREVSRVKPGETFTVISTNNGWYEIQIDEKTTGWVTGQFVKEIN